MQIKVWYSAVDGARSTRRFATLAGAQKYAQRMIGAHPDMSDWYAVSFDGIGKIEVQGCTLDELFPSPEAIDRAAWAAHFDSLPLIEQARQVDDETQGDECGPGRPVTPRDRAILEAASLKFPLEACFACVCGEMWGPVDDGRPYRSAGCECSDMQLIHVGCDCPAENPDMRPVF